MMSLKIQIAYISPLQRFRNAGSRVRVSNPTDKNKAAILLVQQTLTLAPQRSIVTLAV
jgi:ABC-type sugar transport system ATPase subunit